MWRQTEHGTKLEENIKPVQKVEEKTTYRRKFTEFTYTDMFTTPDIFLYLDSQKYVIFPNKIVVLTCNIKKQVRFLYTSVNLQKEGKSV